MELIVCPVALRQMIELNMANGIDVATTSVLRQLPNSARIINAVSPAAVNASFTTSLMHSRTKIDWSVMISMLQAGGTIDLRRGKAFLRALTTLMVDALPFLKILKST